ncbi:hypothetical protein BJ742DRAFT_750619, partial [Cladochytrium replicatum]
MANLKALYVELERLCASGADGEKIAKAADKILKGDPNAHDAKHVKVVVHLRADQYDEALQILETLPLEEYGYERTYALYRLHRLDDALSVVREALASLESTAKGTTKAFKILEAQLHYRMEDFGASVKIYDAILKDLDSDDPYYNEVHVNYTAAKAAARLANVPGVDSKLPKTSIQMYEMTYNLACMALASGNLKEATQLLEKSRKQCRDVLLSESYGEEEIEQELAIIVAQLGYLHQLQGREDEALDLYQGILKSKVADVAITAVVSNNVNAIKRDKDLFDSQKRQKVATAAGVEQKLTKTQLKVISMNGALLSFYAKSAGTAKDLVKKLAEQYPDDDLPPLILAAVSSKNAKNPRKAADELEEYVKSYPTNLGFRLVLCQTQINQLNFSAAIQIMNDYFGVVDKTLQYQPALVSLMVWLYGRVDQVDMAVEWLESATQHWKSSSEEVEDTWTLKQLAAFKLKSHRARDAAKDYERLIRLDPSDCSAIAGLVMAYAEFDLAAAEKYSAALASTESADLEDSAALQEQPIDVEKLESSFSWSKKSEAQPSTELAEDNVGGTPVKPKKKRKRKIRLPKNFDPNAPPDPERWLPKYERSAFLKKAGKRKEKEKDIGRGPQGAAVSGGGLGGTGSANIFGLKQPAAVQSPPAPLSPQLSEVEKTPIARASVAATAANKKKNKKK